MNINNLRPAREFAIQFGVKAIIYGAPGTGKTPILNTAPRPLLLACEPGLVSMRNSNIPTFTGFTAKSIDEFFAWFFNSNELKNFDTIGIDSTSQMCEIYLDEAIKTNKHGLAAYGEMSRNVMRHLEPLYFMPYKNAYLIAKEEITAERIKRPYYPGKELPIKIPHRYDEILHLGIQNIPGKGQLKAFRCIGSIDCLARDRTGNLNEFEEPHFGKLVQKCVA